MVGVDDLAVLEVRPGGTSSSPVDTTVTRGRRCTTDARRRWRRRQREVAGPEPGAGGQHHVAGADVLAAVPQRAARAGARCRATSVAPPSVSSTGHDGVGALGHRGAGHDPQHLARRQHVAAGVAGGDVAGDRQHDRGSRAWRRPARPRARRTRPSPSCRSPAGRCVATTSSASTSPSADPTGTLCSGSGDTRASTVARCSASVRITRRPRGGRRRGWCARRR